MYTDQKSFDFFFINILSFKISNKIQTYEIGKLMFESNIVYAVHSRYYIYICYKSREDHSKLKIKNPKSYINLSWYPALTKAKTKIVLYTFMYYWKFMKNTNQFNKTNSPLNLHRDTSNFNIWNHWLHSVLAGRRQSEPYTIVLYCIVSYSYAMCRHSWKVASLKWTFTKEKLKALPFRKALDVNLLLISVSERYCYFKFIHMYLNNRSWR